MGVKIFTGRTESQKEMTDPTTFAIAVFIKNSIFSLQCSISSLLEFQPFTLKTMTLLLNQFKALMQKKSFSTTQDKSCAKWAFHMDEHNCEWFVTVSDIETVMKKLGIYSPSEQLECENDEKCRDCRLLEVVAHILEEDEASTEELTQAFSVYDENGDGFISAPELQKVMRRLGMEEGVELENCEKMIAAFDVDGDGRIDLWEFTRMLENQR